MMEAGGLGLDRRGVNARWLGATVLTGVCGAALMGGAVWAALESQSRMPRPAELLSVGTRNQTTTSDRITNVARKSGKLNPLADAFSTTRQTIQVSTTSTVGEREVIRVRPHARVIATLVINPSGSPDIPEFNPLRLLAGDQPAKHDDDNVEPDGDISFVSRELTAPGIDPRSFLPAPTAMILAKVREQALLGSALPLAMMPLPGNDEETTPAPPVDASAPNQMTITKKPAETASANAPSDRTLVAKPGDTITTLLMEGGATRDDARAISTALTRNGRSLTLPEGNRLRLEFGQLAPSSRVQPVRVSLFNDRGPDGAVALTDDGKYLPVEMLAKTKRTNETEGEEEETEEEGGVRLYNAVYETALRQNIPKVVIEDLIRLYAHEVDFNRRAQPEDQMEVFYAEDEAEAGRSDILFASLTHGGETRRFYRFTTEDGTYDYYDGNGKSARKFLLRKPIAGGIMRSTFGMRRHPVLGYAKMHTGVDWADRIGTPIVSAGNGVISKAEWDSGYGRRIEVEHGNGYTTSYNHLSGFARGIKDGVRVRQGQVIGYLGNSGLSTGPHLHYEVMVNGRFVDPLRVRVPRGRELEGKMLASFKKNASGSTS